MDPIILGMKLVEQCDCRPCDGCGCEIPPAICACFPEELAASGGAHRLYVTLGQFSIIRMERDTQLLMPAYDYCLPDKECTCQSGGGCAEDPCELFRKVQFPVEEFFPSNCPPPRPGPLCQEPRGGCCGQ